MRLSLPVSFLLHGGLLAWALIGLGETKPFKPDMPEPVQIATITEDGLTRLMQGSRNAKNAQTAMAPARPPTESQKEPPPKLKPPEPTAPPPPPPEPAKVEPPPPPPPKAAEVPPPPPPKPPEPQKDAIAELALKAEADAKLEAERKAAEEKKRLDDARRAEEQRKREEAAKKRRDDLKKKQDEAKKLAEAKRREEEKRKKSADFFDDMEKALVDKDPKKRAPPAPSGSQVASDSNVKGPQAGAPEGRDTKLTGSEMGVIGAIMRETLRRCWSAPPGAESADNVTVDVDFKLSPNGQLIGQPRVVTRIASPLQAAIADNAVRAVIQCQPYTRFPPHLHKGGWEAFTWTFGLREMGR